MSAEELAKHRQLYWEALSKGLDDCRYGLPFTEEGEESNEGQDQRFDF